MLRMPSDEQVQRLTGARPAGRVELLADGRVPVARERHGLRMTGGLSHGTILYGQGSGPEAQAKPRDGKSAGGIHRITGSFSLHFGLCRAR